MKGLIFTYTLTLIGAVAGIVSPFHGFLAYVCLAIVQPTSMWWWEVTSGNFARVVGVSLLLGWVLKSFGSWNFGRATLPLAALLAYWGWMTCSAVQAEDQAKAWDIVVFHAKVFLPMLAALTLLRSIADLKLLAWVILLSQGYVAFELNLFYYGGYNRVLEEGFAGMDNNTVAIAMVTCVGLAFFLGMGTTKWWMQALAFGSAVLMAHVIMFSFSRGGILALGLTGCMAFFLIPKKPRHYLLFAVAVALAFRLAGPEVRERFMTIFFKSDSGVIEASAQSRLDLWSDALDATLKRPVFGVGPDNWGGIAAEYGWPKGKEVHSLWMQCAAELGFPGVLLLLSFYALVIGRLWPLAKEKTPVGDPWVRDAARMVIAALFGFAVASQFVTIKLMEVQYYIALIGLGVLMLTSVPGMLPPPQTPEPASAPAPVHAELAYPRFRRRPSPRETQGAVRLGDTHRSIGPRTPRSQRRPDREKP